MNIPIVQLNYETKSMGKSLIFLPNYKTFLLLFTCLVFVYQQSKAQGTWIPVTDTSCSPSGGAMLLLSDGSVIATGSDVVWYKLTPDIHGSYTNGSWSPISPMYDTRLYFSSQVLKDGRVYVAGGEYGTGEAGCEIYDPVYDSWTVIPAIGNYFFADANSEILPDGKVLQGLVSGWGRGCLIFDPASNTYSYTDSSLGSHDESAWVKLKDNSILFVHFGGLGSERYIPALHTWVADGNIPVNLYDSLGETGPAFLLPDGRAFFLGASGKTAYYTPSGNNTPGIWAAGPNIPNGLSTPDAPGAMMANGKILCALAPPGDAINFFQSPTYFYEFNYLTNSYTKVNAPIGGDTISAPSYIFTMLDLPDGGVLLGIQGSNQYFEYVPSSSPLPAGKPAISNVIKINCDTFKLTGTLFNGICEGAAYGDDWQMATNYPIVRLKSGPDVYYARTYNWNRTGVQTGTLPDTTLFTLPAGLPTGTYSLVVVANGNPSDSVSFSTCGVGVEEVVYENKYLQAYPNPANNITTAVFNSVNGGRYDIILLNVLGQPVIKENGEAVPGNNTHTLHVEGVPKGLYTLILHEKDSVSETKIVIE
jgi:hypothetical protein